MMKRRNFIKQTAAALGAIVVADATLGQSVTERSYDSATLSIKLVEEVPGVTSLYMMEHGDADQVAIEAFYWTMLGQQRLMLHKETTAPLVKEMTVGADLPMPVTSIVFLRVREMKLLRQSEFGRTPEEKK